MFSIVAILTVLATAVLIAVADALIKHAAVSGDFWSAVFSPWMVLICVLYFVQILLAVYIFMNKGGLAIYGNLFIVFYSIMMVMLGIIFFKEHLTMIQGLGIILALAGAMLLNSGL